MSVLAFVSPLTSVLASESKASNWPSSLSEGLSDAASACVPSLATLARVVRAACPSQG
jgi:hypothetical protein